MERASQRCRLAGIALLVAGAACSVAWADCPSLTLDELLVSVPLESAARTGQLRLPIPEPLYREALGRPGVPALRREGPLAQAVVVVDLEVERLWMAINDDGHHARKGYLPLAMSQVVAGEPARSGRRTVQAFERFGLGRWWVVELEMNADLYERSEARLWELGWRDVMSEYPSGPPIEIGVSVGRIERTEGAWLLARLDRNCTLVEYVATGEPGGFMGLIQWMVATRALRSTIEGMLDLARRHIGREPDEHSFVRPDGSRLAESVSTRSGGGER